MTSNVSAAVPLIDVRAAQTKRDLQAQPRNNYELFGPGGERNLDAKRTLLLLKKRIKELTKERDQLFMEFDALLA